MYMCTALTKILRSDCYRRKEFHSYRWNMDAFINTNFNLIQIKLLGIDKDVCVFLSITQQHH